MNSLIKIILLIAILPFACLQHAQAQGIRNESAYIYNNGASIYIATAGTGHYTSNGTGRITPVGAAAMYVYGNWVNNASNTGFTADAGTVYMDGTNQSLGGTNQTVFYNLSLRNGGIKTMNVNISAGGMTTLTGLLGLTNAELNLNQYTLTITNPGMSIARTTGFINSENGCGTCNVWSSAVTWSITTNTGARTIPFGLSGSGTYLPFVFNKTNAVNSNVTVSTRSATATNNTPLPTNVTHMNVPNIPATQPNDATNTVIDRWWYVTPSTGSATPVSLDLNMTYRGGENTCTGCPQTGNFGAQYWVNYSVTNYGWKLNNAVYGLWPGVTAGTQGAGTTTGALNLPDGGLSTSYWVLSCTAKPLPIGLVYFTATCQNNGNTLLQWKTATEINAHHFEVQKSSNAVDFTTVGLTSAQYPNGGTYSFTDTQKNTSIVYYRLKMVDMDGSFKYSAIADLASDQCLSVKTNIYGVSKNIITDINSPTNQTVNVVIIDALGRILLNQSLTVADGYNQFHFPMDVANSIYFVKLIDETGAVLAVQKVMLSE